MTTPWSQWSEWNDRTWPAVAQARERFRCRLFLGEWEFEYQREVIPHIYAQFIPVSIGFVNPKIDAK